MTISLLEEKLIRPRRIILTGRSRPGRMRLYLAENEPVLGRKTKLLWKVMGEAISRSDVERILETGSLPQGLIDEWVIIGAEWLEAVLEPEWKKAIKTAGMEMFSALERKQAEFNPVHTNILEWMRKRGGMLIRELTQGQASTINALLRHQVFQSVTSPYQLARLLRAFVGLLEREARAVANYRAELSAQGLGVEKIEKLADRYATFLLNARAERIARTEPASAFCFGQWEGVRQMRDAGFVEEVRKEWLTADDERTCTECGALDGETVGLDEEFSIGVLHPPAHVQCRCDVGYSAIRR